MKSTPTFLSFYYTLYVLKTNLGTYLGTKLTENYLHKDA